jgi:hypothetical protein
MKNYTELFIHYMNINKMDNYAIQVLEREIYLIEKCLSEWELLQYREARIERIKRLDELKQAVRELKQ